MYFGEDEYQNIFKETDTNGLVTIDMNCRTPQVTYAVSTHGKYSDGMRRMDIGGIAYYRDGSHNYSFENEDSGRWHPWNPTIELTIRRILNPIPMYAKRMQMGDSRIPTFSESLGYDLEKGDWLSPHGNGQTADFTFRLDCEYGETLPGDVTSFDAMLTMTFSNMDDGIIEFADSQPELEGSIYRLSRFAPEGGYSNRWSLHQFETKEGSSPIQPINLNYFFRVRTKTNETGQIISAHYGKIRNAINFGVGGRNPTLQMTYYLNPTSNDRNMEFDPSRNLFTDLEMREQVQEP